MKKFSCVLFVLMAAVSLGMAQQASSGLKVGDVGPAGGTIVYAEGNQYLECTPVLAKAPWQQAIALCQEYTGGGYDDWHLPTKEELDLVYAYYGKDGAIGTNDWYWSASQRNGKYAWVQRFITGRHYGAFKTNTYLVRAVRSFSQ